MAAQRNHRSIVGLHARPAALFVQAVAATGMPVRSAGPATSRSMRPASSG